MNGIRLPTFTSGTCVAPRKVKRPCSTCDRGVRRLIFSTEGPLMRHTKLCLDCAECTRVKTAGRNSCRVRNGESIGQAGQKGVTTRNWTCRRFAPFRKGDTVKNSHSKKARLFTAVLPELAAAAPYFSLAAVKRRLAELDMALADDSLLHYLSDAVADGCIHNAGKGWYSRLERPLILDRKPLAHLIRLVRTKFPLLEFCCWSTHQINPFTHHILAKHTIFLYADADLLPAVSDSLRTEKWDVLPDPSNKEIQRLYYPGDRSVILRPAISRQPASVDHLAAPEKVLVDLQVETDAAMLMDRAEALSVCYKAASSCILNIAEVISYAKRRRADIFRESDSSSPQNLILWR